MPDAVLTVAHLNILIPLAELYSAALND